MRPGPNHAQAPLGVLPERHHAFDWAGDVSPRPESDAIVYELHVKGFTRHPSSGVQHPNPEPMPA
jgi:isoamylase